MSASERERQAERANLGDWKRNFNIAYSLMVIHQRAIVVPFRKGWGLKALAVPCVWAFAVMVGWAALSRDIFMWLWVAIWLLCLLKRRQETTKLINGGARIHSESDGWPDFSNNKAAKAVLEPFIVGWLGLFLYWVYEQYGMPVAGLPYFFLAGVVSLPFVEIVRRRIQEERVQSMIDSRLEQEGLMNEVRERMGDFH